MANASGGVWAPYKELFNTVHSAIALKQPQSYYSLDSVLKKHKLDMISLLKNPAKNSTHRTQVQNATQNGLKVSNISQPLILPKDFIDEALILSDILDLNEIASVELLLVGEKHQPDFPTLSRGLVAVLLYYDGRRNLVVSLRSLIQGGEGISWTLGLEQHLSNLVTSFVSELVQNDLVAKIIRLLKDMNLERDLENLSRGKAIKDSHHRQQITDLIKETYQGLMDCLLYLACQNPLPKDPLLKIILELKKVPGIDEGFSPLDPISLALFFTFLVSLRVCETDTPTLDSSLVDDHYPFLSDAGSLSLLHNEITNKSQWLNSSLEAAVKFAWAVFLRECASLDTFNECDELEEDEKLIDEAINCHAFQFIRQSVIASQNFLQEEYYTRALHHVFTTYIHMMPVKITELRNHGDEVAREEMLRTLRGAPPSTQLSQNFGELMLLLGNLYSSDPHDLNLSLDYWPNTEQPSNQAYQHKTLSLYKFLYQCSDLLPPSLFHSFMIMLCGLSSSSATAHYCFEFLKSNSPSQGGGGPSAVISFDHFFHSLRQYYIGLKQAVSSSGCGISPQELEGLVIVLKLITLIVEKDEIGRGMIYDNQTWVPVATLFGLIGCPVSRKLKCQILLALSAFAKSPEIATIMWNTVELSQILNTSMSSSGHYGGVSGTTGGQFGLMTHPQQEGSIQIELEEMESAAEEYFLTRSFLTLLVQLIEVPFPLSLGATHRVPGFQPYLEFVRDSVFLKFDTRSYKDPQEKWIVASDSMTVLLKLLENHELNSEDFIEQKYEISKGYFVTLPRQPGFVILLHLLNDSALLRKLLYIVSECYSLLSDGDSCTKEIEQASLLALKMLETALFKQEEFMALLRSSSAHSVMATPLDSLLFGINPRSGKADHYLNITKYVTLSKVSPELSQVAVRIIGLASRSSVIGKNVLDSLTANNGSSREIVHGFVDHLEWEGDDPLSEDYRIQRQLKEDILNLLISCVLRSTPNIAHLLLGFVLTKDSIGPRPKKLSDTILQDPGVLGSPKTCLHSVMSFVKVNNHTSSLPSAAEEGCHMTHPKLAELSYQLLYHLSASKELGQPVLRYLRNNHDFFYAQLSQLPFSWLSGYHDDPEGHMICYNQMSWILCCVAIELKMAVSANQKSHAQRLSSVLLKLSSSLSQEEMMAAWGDGHTAIEEEKGGGARRKILRLLDLLDLSLLTTPSLELQYFDETRTEEVIKSCETKEKGMTFFNVKLLHRLLINELNSLQGTIAVSQKPFILKEIRGILDTVVKRNHTQELLNTRHMYVEAWQHVVEILMGVVNEEGKEKQRIDVLFELIQDLLIKVENCEANTLTAIAYSIVFTLMSHLRHILSSSSSHHTSETAATPTATAPLQSILKRLLNGLLECPSGMQRLRSYLYATLLCYLHMTKERESEMENYKGGLWRLEYDVSLSSVNVSILSGCGDNLMDTVCRDACNGHDIPKMLALSILDSILYLDKHGVWLKFMITRGYLLTIVSSLQQDNQSLLRMLHPQPDVLRPLYVYESKMAFLILVASTSLGAREIVSKNCVDMLSQCTFIDQRPMHSEMGGASEGFIPSVWTRYLQLFLPVLRFLLSLLSTSGSQTPQAINQVTHFIAAHIDVFASVLKEGCPPVSMATLQELTLVTAIISHCRAGHDWLLDLNQEHTVKLLQLQQLVLTLVPHYLLPSKWVWSQESEGGAYFNQLIGSNINSSVDKELNEERFDLSQKVCSNLVLYCRNAVSLGGKDFNSKNIRILFSCDLSKFVSSVPSVVKTSSSLSLALLVSSLDEMCDSHMSVLEKLQVYRNKFDNLKNLTSDELKHLHSDISSDDITQLSSSQLYQQIKTSLDRLITNKQQQLEQFIYIIEHLLCILWSHLQFYLVHYQPSDQYTLTQVNNRSIRSLQTTGDNSTVDPLVQLSSSITMRDIEELKVNALKTFTDSFFKKLLDVCESQVTSNDMSSISFIDGLVRRVRKLLKLRAAARPVLRLN